MAGRRGGGVCVSADSEAGVRSVVLHWAVLAFSAVGFEISADSAGHTGRCNTFLVGASVLHLIGGAVFPARTLRFSPVSALAAAAEPLG